MDLSLVPLETYEPDQREVEALHREPSTARYFPLSPAWFTAGAETTGIVYYKIMEGDRLLGGVCAELAEGTLSLQVCVGEAWRRRGIAFHALRALLESLPEGIGRAEARVDAEDLPALGLFEKLGFRRCGWADGTLTYRRTL